VLWPRHGEPYTLGGFLHLLLVLAIIAVLINLIAPPRV
jgi:hypothetical protein